MDNGKSMSLAFKNLLQILNIGITAFIYKKLLGIG